jgi:hypothetical protein
LGRTNALWLHSVTVNVELDNSTSDSPLRSQWKNSLHGQPRKLLFAAAQPDLNNSYYCVL